MNHLSITGIRVTPATVGQLHEGISAIISSGRQGFVLSGNVHGLNTAHRLPWLKSFYNRADIVRVDGAGIVWAARLLGYSIPPRMTWADWGWLLADYCAAQGHSLFLLGGPPDCAKRTAELLAARAPALQIAGVQDGYFSKTADGNAQIVEKINDASPDILVVGMGMPRQERWILDNCNNLAAKAILTAGAAFEYLSGSIRRCPQWMGRAGFEWLFRLAMEPRRMANRYIAGNLVFMARVLAQWGAHQIEGPRRTGRPSTSGSLAGHDQPASS